MESHNNILIMPLWVNLRLKIVMFVSYTFFNLVFCAKVAVFTLNTEKSDKITRH
jgi:hypothetical protein